MGVKIPAWRSVVACEVRLQSPTLKAEYGASSPYGLCGIYPIVGLFSLTFEVLNNSGVWRAAEGYCREEELVQWLLRVEAIERGGSFEAPDEGAVEFCLFLGLSSPSFGLGFRGSSYVLPALVFHPCMLTKYQ
ncbi:hypothetical protein IGI04_026635 [Brassica rapa subsp. trilocularis]|uniref:Uncharacterized protein n=1 Tax=Brassica rapa subsp. trilocularis TaxID=1813537 RepID=A0ABQ7L0E6_BRACM|nr:hypothetical protein IGI04_026635 [Brassica rapa subsp. trilocularis]